MFESRRSHLLLYPLHFLGLLLTHLRELVPVSWEDPLPGRFVLKKESQKPAP